MEERLDIVDTAIAAGNFMTLVAVLGAAGLIPTLKGDGPFTVFAPTDDAFAKVPAETLGQLLQPENKEKLAAILTYHVVPGRVTAHEAMNLVPAKAATVQGQSLIITGTGGLTINDAKVIAPDVEAANGVIHVIDGVLMPSDVAAAWHFSSKGGERELRHTRGNSGLRPLFRI